MNETVPLIYIRAPLADFALRARERLELAQLLVCGRKHRAPGIGVPGVLDHVRPGSRVQGEFGVDAHEPFFGEQVDVVVVVEGHR